MENLHSLFIRIRASAVVDLFSLRVRGHQDDERDYVDLTRPERLNVLADHRATDALDDLRVQLDNPHNSTHFPPDEAIFVMPPDISLVANSARSKLNSLRTSFGRTYKNPTIGQTRSLIPSAGLHTDQPLLYSLTVSGLLWLNSFIAGYPSAAAKDDAALRRISARSATKAGPYFTCTAARPVHLGAISLSLNSTGTLKTTTLPPTYAASLYRVSSAGLSTAIRRILIPDSTDLILQIGWFQVLKGYIPHLVRSV
jgi:hypothetical protein